MRKFISINIGTLKSPSLFSEASVSKVGCLWVHTIKLGGLSLINHQILYLLVLFFHVTV